MKKMRFKVGAASFYIVAFSTLILMIVAISFATVIISEVERTSNDDLAQSAYDSALAGVEDAKLAYYNYRNCLMQKKEGLINSNRQSGPVSCENIIKYVDEANKNENCDTVWNILGKDSSQIIEVKDGVSNNMAQSTTCVTMTTELNDYSTTLSQSNAVDVIKLSFEEGVNVNDIVSLKLRWFSSKNATNNRINYEADQKKGRFPKSLPSNIIAPPVISLTLLQTTKIFTYDSFDVVDGEDRTNRGTLFFIPNEERSDPIGKNAFVKSNDKKAQNDPYRVKCTGRDNTVDEFACSVDVELPGPIKNGGDDARSEDTFEVIVALPYAQYPTDVSLKFYCRNGGECGDVERQNVEENGEASLVKLKDVQIEVDSTGRANDLFRRVVTRLKNVNDLTFSVMGVLELLDADNGYGSAGLWKNWSVTSEHDLFQ